MTFDDLAERGLQIVDGFLGPAAADEVVAELRALEHSGALQPAGMSRGDAYRQKGDERGDRIAWLDRDGAAPALVRLLDAFDALRETLNRAAFLGLARFEAQAALYPGGGARYVRHRDAFAAPPGARPNRRLTAIWYANPDWHPAHGGLLRVHLPSGPVDVEPLLDRLVVFESERLEHEVLPAHAPRWAVTAWYRGY